MVNSLYGDIPEDGIEIKHTIYDRFGDAYTVGGNLSPSGLLSYVTSKKHCVGRINWTTSKSAVLTIADLIIFDKNHYRKPLWSHVLPVLYRPINYRGRGLGAAMLKFIIESAQNMGISEVNGWITSDDLKVTPFLPEFYRNHGFMVGDDLTIWRNLCGIDC